MSSREEKRELRCQKCGAPLRPTVTGKAYYCPRCDYSTKTCPKCGSQMFLDDWIDSYNWVTYWYCPKCGYVEIALAFPI